MKPKKLKNYKIRSKHWSWSWSRSHSWLWSWSWSWSWHLSNIKPTSWVKFYIYPRSWR